MVFLPLRTSTMHYIKRYMPLLGWPERGRWVQFLARDPASVPEVPDWHRALAAVIFSETYEGVSDPQRRFAKAVHLTQLYNPSVDAAEAWRALFSSGTTRLRWGARIRFPKLARAVRRVLYGPARRWTPPR